MRLKVGARFRSTVCETELIIVRAPHKDLDIACGGRPIVPREDTASQGERLVLEHAGGSEIGKRYVDEDLGIEVLVTKPGRGTLSVDGEALRIKEARKLPTSD